MTLLRFLLLSCAGASAALIISPHVASMAKPTAVDTADVQIHCAGVSGLQLRPGTQLRTAPVLRAVQLSRALPMMQAEQPPEEGYQTFYLDGFEPDGRESMLAPGGASTSDRSPAATGTAASPIVVAAGAASIIGGRSTQEDSTILALDEAAAMPQRALESAKEAALPEPVAKALNAVQQAAASAAESAIESAKEAAQAALDEAAAMPQRALESIREALQRAAAEAKASALSLPDTLATAAATQIKAQVRKAQFPVEVAKAQRDIKKAELDILKVKAQRDLKKLGN